MSVRPQKYKTKAHHGATARRSRNQRQDLCTTEALRHGETQKIDELFWPSGTLGLFQGAVSVFQTSSHQQKAEDTEVLNLPRLACIRTMTPNLRKKTRIQGVVIRSHRETLG